MSKGVKPQPFPPTTTPYNDFTILDKGLVFLNRFFYADETITLNTLIFGRKGFDFFELRHRF